MEKRLYTTTYNHKNTNLTTNDFLKFVLLVLKWLSYTAKYTWQSGCHTEMPQAARCYAKMLDYFTSFVVTFMFKLLIMKLMEAPPMGALRIYSTCKMPVLPS